MRGGGGRAGERGEAKVRRRCVCLWGEVGWGKYTVGERFTSHSSVQTGLFSRVWLQISKLTHSSGRSGGRGSTCSLSPSRVLLSRCCRGFDWLQQPPRPERRGEPNEGPWSRRDNLARFSEAIVVRRGCNCWLLRSSLLQNVRKVTSSNCLFVRPCHGRQREATKVSHLRSWDKKLLCLCLHFSQNHWNLLLGATSRKQMSISQTHQRTANTNFSFLRIGFGNCANFAFLTKSDETSTTQMLGWIQEPVN